ncbi:glycosyltransferase family 2 protein [Myxosarcina sp. GI1]|uniref:glycosyltransferase family 2 protein n=1 Tax=Myxosarcina sp. GI1 TaxID=1541065 RepID=UPI00055F62A4|nr:glycosyltransferase family 2 protein [Myxosarcina sp. GI1]
MELRELISLALLGGGLVLFVPCFLFFIECLVAFNAKKQSNSIAIARPKTTVLIPAHNEAAQIEPVLKTVIAQLTERDRVVVIADNCEDNTAEIARATGATVIERASATHKGKGYALDYGMKFIRGDRPEVVVILDGDCIIAPLTIERITCKAIATGRPVQATYLMEQPDETSLKDRISMFALKVKNLVRLLGLNRLGYHCLLTGSGMAFPLSVIERVSLAGSKTTDDTQLTVDLALTGCTPVFCEDALVMGRLMKDEDAQSQKSRWEHGQLEMILVEVPRLFKAFINQRRLSLLILALDLLIPPLSLLIMFWLVWTIIAWLAAFIGASLIGAIVSTLAGSFLFTGVFLAWIKFGRFDLPLSNLIAIPNYVLGKIPIYFNFLVNPQSRWLKTERDISN